MIILFLGFFLSFLCRTENLILRYLGQLSGPNSKTCSLSSLEFAQNDHFILVSDGINKKLRNKKIRIKTEYYRKQYKSRSQTMF